MKNLLFLLLSCSIYCTWLNQTTFYSNSELTSISATSFVDHKDSGKAKVNAKFPFGCAQLGKYKYPKKFNGDHQNYGQLKKQDEKDFEKIKLCFHAINSVKTIKTPKPKSVELIEIGNNFKGAYNLNSVLQKTTDSCRYRLPNIGIYECYYAFNAYGNILLFNPKTNKGKVLNVFANDLAGDGETIMRYFLMEKNVIHIYEAYCFDDGCTIYESFNILINSDGVVNVKLRNVKQRNVKY